MQKGFLQSPFLRSKDVYSIIVLDLFFFDWDAIIHSRKYHLKNSLKSQEKISVSSISISTEGLLYPFSTLEKIPVVT